MTETTDASLQQSPLLNHPLDEPAVFRPEQLLAAVRAQRGVDDQAVPELCVLEFDGDLTDKLIARDEVVRCEHWPCFHTDMWLWPKEKPRCGIVTRTIGGPYTVLVAEQMAACGAKAIVGLASAGRVSTALPLPSIVVADEAIRDEGTSLHYLPPGQTVAGDPDLATSLAQALHEIGLPVRRGSVWTTDGPYRETRSQLDHWAAQDVLAVEMQAASLFAFGQRQGVMTGLVAHVTNASDGNDDGEDFDKGPAEIDTAILAALCQLQR